MKKLAFNFDEIIPGFVSVLFHAKTKNGYVTAPVDELHHRTNCLVL